MNTAATLNRKKVLIVEDDFLIAQGLSDVMRDAGYAVYAPVGSSAAALRLLRDERPDGVLLDVELTDSDASPDDADLVPDPDRLEDDLVAELAHSSVFASHFRQAAANARLISRYSSRVGS